MQGVPKADKLETIVRAATELGVTRVVPAIAARTVVRLTESQASARVARWQRVARKAAKQCGRAVVPNVTPARALEKCLEEARDTDLALCVWEGESRPLGVVLAEAKRPRRVTVLIGPEGGLERREIDAARAAGWQLVGLGARILRTETAGPAVIAILQSRWGDLGTV